ncbi:MAG: flagellin, partial [Planctomycetota bacterium]
FQKNTVGATINSLSISLENTAAAESSIRDTDFAAETAALTRSQILGQAATQALAIAKTPSRPRSWRCSSKPATLTRVWIRARAGTDLLTLAGHTSQKVRRRAAKTPAAA